MATPAQYEAMAALALGQLADREFAFVGLEAEAKISDRRWESLTTKIDPHHLTAALRKMIAAGSLAETVAATRGGRQIKVVHRPIAHGTARTIADASARKRLLHARYLSWATGSKTGGQGAIGPGLEGVIHTSLQAAAQHGYRLINPVSGEVRQLFGLPVVGGSIDNGAWLTKLDPETFVPRGTFLVLIEAKNVRQWIYPRTQELHQLLAKAAVIQVDHPELRMVPVLICRKAHYLTTVMAQEVGFYVIQTQRQYVRPFLADNDESRRYLGEVNAELAYDLVPDDGPVEPMVRHFRSPLQSVAERTADRWAASAPYMASTFAVLRSDTLRYDERAAAMGELAGLAGLAHNGEAVGWHSSSFQP